MKLHISEYKSNILKLFTGTSIAQLIPIISSPLLTRIYNPSDFGIYATFLAFSAVLSIIASLRFEAAIVIPPENSKAENLFDLITFSSISVAIFLQILFYVLQLLDIIFNMGVFVHLIAFSVFIHTIYNNFYYMLLRKKKYKYLATARVLISFFTLTFSLIIPIFVRGAFGLILSTLIAYLIVVVFLAKKNNTKLPAFDWLSLKSTFIEFKKFPIFDLPSAFLIQFSNRLPVLLLSNYFPIKSIGQYSITQRMLDLPVSFITTAISDTFKQKAAADYNAKGNCLSVFYETRKILIYLAIFPYIVIQFFAPKIFSIVFGSEWVIAGEYAQILAFMFLLRFVIGPLTYTFYIRDKMNINLLGQFFKFLANLLALGVGIYFNDIKIGLILFAATNSVVFIFYYFFALKYAK